MLQVSWQEEIKLHVSLDERKKVKYGKLDQIASPLFLIMDISGNLNGANDHMIWWETDIKTIFKDKQDDEVFMASHYKTSLLLLPI